MYYGLILISVVMFGGSFAINDIYRQRRGSGLRVSMESSFWGAVAGFMVLLATNGIHIEFSWFTLIMATIAAVNGIAFMYLSFKALDIINLSLFSLFTMLGGMLLPFLQGIAFYGEKITLAKIVCVVFICAALALTVERGEKSKGYIYYIGIFVLNGMSGVLSKLFVELPYKKTGAAGYSIWIAIVTAVLSAVFWIALKNNNTEKSYRKSFDIKSQSLAAAGGAINRFANFILVIALVHVDSSAQYPLVTGGVMVVSTIICFFGKRKPRRREILSVVLAFASTLALFVIPI